MMVEIKLDGLVVSKSKNLRAIQRYPQPIEAVTIFEASGTSGWTDPDYGADLVVIFENGAKCETRFASASVCREWCERSRKIPNSKVTYFPAHPQVIL